MIGYHITRKELEKQIEAEKKGWLARAKKKTEEFRAKGTYSESSSIWSEIKGVYMTLQGECKCAFCERKLESQEYGKGEQDVEHFRPKSNVREWKLPKELADLGVTTAPAPTKGGYYLLTYHPFNYSVACKPCNSVLKRDYFPIAREHELTGDDPKALLSENPLLIYPIGDFDTKPEELIRFHGVSPQAVASEGYGRARALVTIEFFQLDDETGRKNLLRERAAVIVAMFPQLETVAENVSATRKKTATTIINGYTSSKAPHANCARCYKSLFESDRNEAENIFELAATFIESVS